MHEMSVALEVCRIAEDQVGRAALADVLEVGVEVGRRSGVEPANLEFCLEALLSRPPFGRAAATLIRLSGDVLRVSYLELDDDARDGADAGPGSAERDDDAGRETATRGTEAGGGPR